MSFNTRRNFFIAIVGIMIIFFPLFISSVGGAGYLRRLEYLTANGRVVEGTVTHYKKSRFPNNNSSYDSVIFRLYQGYSEDGKDWETYRYWDIREDKVKEIEEREDWIKAQIGKKIDLIIDDTGMCDLVSRVYRRLEDQRHFVWVRGAVFGAVELICIVALFVVIFYKSPRKERDCAFISKTDKDN